MRWPGTAGQVAEATLREAELLTLWTGSRVGSVCESGSPDSASNVMQNKLWRCPRAQLQRSWAMS